MQPPPEITSQYAPAGRPVAVEMSTGVPMPPSIALPRLCAITEVLRVRKTRDAVSPAAAWFGSVTMCASM